MSGPIIVATDFSPRADRAIDRALMLGAQWKRQVKLLHVVDKDRSKVDQAALDRMMEGVLPEGWPGTAEVEFLYIEGSPPHAIAEAAEQLDAALVVLGPARYNSLGDYFLGTAVDHALRHCMRPILVVKQRPHRFYDKIVVTTDLSGPSAGALALACGWFPEAAVHLTYACHIPFDSWQKEERMREEVFAAEKLRIGDFIQTADLSPQQRRQITPHLVQAGAHQALNRTVNDVGANLVVIGSQGESGLRHATIGRTANALMETSPVDTLMVTQRE